tara:strand:+ start:120 stop:419 length:300 start_codon:yes stop_codon:yes gene_type:complete
MRTCLDRLAAQSHVDGPRVRGEADFIASRLEKSRLEKTISNDAFLDAVAIQGALEIIAKHIEVDVSQSEIQELISQQIDRAERIEEKNPGLNTIIESRS